MANELPKYDAGIARAIRRQRLRFLLVGLVAVTLWRDIAFLSASPYPYGIDGYYYLALAEGSGWTLSGRTVPILPTALLRAVAVVLPPAVAIKVTGLALLYACGIAAYAIVRQLCRNPLVAALSFFLVVKGFLRAELLVNFPKQTMGQLCVLLVALCLVAWRPASEWRRWACLIAILVAAALTHPVSLGLSVMVIASWIALRLVEFFAPGQAGSILFAASVALTWAAVFLASQMHSAFERWGTMLYLSTSATPRFTLPLFYDGFSPITRYFPATFFETILLCLAILGLAALSWRVGASTVQPGLKRLSCAALLFVPQVALIFCPFLVPAHLDRVGLHFRLLGSLGPAAAIIVPIAVYAFFPYRRNWVAVGLAVLLALPPHAWSISVSPPVDGGELHRAMLDATDDIPPDAVIITSQAIGNMVTALWHRPRVVATRFDPPLSQANYYRLSVFEPDVKNDLEAYVASQNDVTAVRTLVGPWLLVKEGTYRSFREHLREANPDLAERLVE